MEQWINAHGRQICEEQVSSTTQYFPASKLPAALADQPHLLILVRSEELQQVHVCVLLRKVELLAHKHCISALSRLRRL